MNMQISTVRGVRVTGYDYATASAQTKLNRYNGFSTRYTRTTTVYDIVFVVDGVLRMLFENTMRFFAIIASESQGKAWVYYECIIQYTTTAIFSSFPAVAVGVLI